MDYLLYGGIGLSVIIIVLIIIKSSKKHTQSGFAITEIGESDPDKNYYVLSDISFHDGVRNATISHLIINPTGLHVVSEFPYEGEIEGSEDADLWTYEHKGVTDSFKNPIQVSSYLKVSIDKVLKKDLPIHRYIVFPEKAKLPRNRMSMNILLSHELTDEMNERMKSKKKISVTDVKNTYDLFNQMKQRS